MLILTGTPKNHVLSATWAALSLVNLTLKINPHNSFSKMKSVFFTIFFKSQTMQEKKNLSWIKCQNFTTEFFFIFFHQKHFNRKHLVLHLHNPALPTSPSSQPCSVALGGPAVCSATHNIKRSDLLSLPGRYWELHVYCLLTRLPINVDRE